MKIKIWKWFALPLVLGLWIIWLSQYLSPSIDSWKPGKARISVAKLEKQKNGRYNAVLHYSYIQQKDTVHAEEVFDYNLELSEAEATARRMLYAKQYPTGSEINILINPSQPLESTAFPDITREAQRSMVWGYVAIFLTIGWVVWAFRK